MSTLRPGTSLVAAGYCLYSSSVFFCLTLGAGVNIFTLDRQIGEFILTYPNLQIPPRGKIYSFNEANKNEWDKPLQDYVTDIQQGKGQTGQKYISRYIGSMVGDIHRTLMYGGNFVVNGCHSYSMLSEIFNHAFAWARDFRCLWLSCDAKEPEWKASFVI